LADNAVHESGGLLQPSEDAETLL